MASPSVEIEQGFGLIPWDERLAVVIDDGFIKISEVFVGFQLFHRGWDQHIAITRLLPNQCRDTDQPSAIWENAASPSMSPRNDIRTS